MKPRLAIVSMLAAGALLAFGGSGLAISGISGSGDAGIAQYEPDIEDTEAVGTAEDERDRDATGTQTARQVGAAGEDTLPFTGLAAIPLIAAGLGLMAGGLVVRRRTRTTP